MLRRRSGDGRRGLKVDIDIDGPVVVLGAVEWTSSNTAFLLLYPCLPSSGMSEGQDTYSASKRP